MHYYAAYLLLAPVSVEAHLTAPQDKVTAVPAAPKAVLAVLLPEPALETILHALDGLALLLLTRKEEDDVGIGSG